MTYQKLYRNYIDKKCILYTVGWGARKFDKASHFPLGFWAQRSVSLHTRMYVNCSNILDISWYFKLRRNQYTHAHSMLCPG